jgi:DNA-directed RNA polymerase specialized sigma24 family protein
VAIEFPPTPWSDIVRLQQQEGRARAELLDRLLTRYWDAVHAYLRAVRPRLDAEGARELRQQFFAMLLERGDLDRVAAARGSFRGFLKTAIRHFTIDVLRAERARPPAEPIDPDAVVAADADARGPEAAFDEAWSRQVLDEAVARRFGVNEDAVRNRLREARHQLRRIVVQVVREYLAPDADPEEEIRALLEP